MGDIQIFTDGAYSDLVRYRWQHPTILDMQVPMVLVMFLVGLVVGRSGILDEPQCYQAYLLRWWKLALMFGLIGNVLFLVGYAEQKSWLVSVGIHVGAPLLSFVYAAWVLLHAERLRVLAPVGQMALTNYLLQSLIGTTLFYGYGFGLYDRLSPTMMVIFVLVIFTGQIIFSRLWLRRYRFGLMEWLWRSLTYGQWQSFRRETIS